MTVDFRYVARAARAEGLDYLAVAQRWKLPVESPEAIEQACRAAGSPGFLLTWNMEAPKNYLRGDAGHCLGHGWTVGMAGRDAEGRSVIDTLNSVNAHDYESAKRPAPNFESHAYIHACGGIVSYTHPCRWWTGKWGGRGGFPVDDRKFISNMAIELPFDTIAGPTYDMLDILMQTHESVQNENALRLWFLLLNHGYRIAGTASSDATFDNPGRGVPGAVRVYTRVSGQPSIRTLQSAMKSCRNFVTSGPLLLWNIGAHGIGDAAPLNPGFDGESRLRLWASGTPGEHLTRAEIIRNGEVWRTFPISGKPTSTELNFRLRETDPCWYVVRCYGSNDRQVAISNPIWFEREPYRAPEPAAARVSMEVRDSSGRPLNGRCDVLEYAGPTARQLASHRVTDGRAEFAAAATSRLKVHAEGFAPAEKSLFLDVPALLEPCLRLRVPGMLDWTTFASIRERLQSVRIGFELK